MTAPLKKHDIDAIPIPASLAGRPRDKRGYPIPFTVAIDRTGRPDFKVVDQDRLIQVVTRKLCGLSGRPLEKTVHPKGGFWFVGGPKCAFHERGAYLDPFARYEALQYALKVCPFLAIPGMAMASNYDKVAARAADDQVIVVHDHVNPDQPNVFVLVQATRYDLIETESGVLFKPRWPFRSVEFWRHGERITVDEARALSSDIPADLSTFVRKI